MSDDLSQRREWFEWYIERLDTGVHEEPRDDIKFACPCCGYPTLDERGGYEICELCNWEDDGQDDPQSDEVWGGPNGRYSLTEARENFKLYGVMYAPGRDMRAAGDSELEIRTKNEIKAAFGRMADASPEEQERLTRIIEEGRAALHAELQRKVIEVERQLTKGDS